MQSTPVQSSSRRPPGFLRLPRLESNGWSTAASTRVNSPWDYSAQSPYTDTTPGSAVPPVLQPLRLSLLQHRMDSSASMTVNPPESPRPLSPATPLSPARFSRSDGSALGIIVPPGTPPADALPRWLVDRKFSRNKSPSQARSPSGGPTHRPTFDFPSFALGSPTTYDWRFEPRSLVRTPDAIGPSDEGQSDIPHVLSLDSFPFDMSAVSGERINTPVEPRIRPRPLPRCSSDDMADGRLFRVNARGEHDSQSPTNAANGLFSLMHGQGERRDRNRRLPPSRLASRAPSRAPTPE